MNTIYPDESVPPPPPSPVASANPLLSSLLGAPSPCLESGQLQTTKETYSIGTKSISIVAVDPNGKSIATNNTVYEVEAVMDVTIDLENATTFDLSEFMVTIWLYLMQNLTMF